MPSQKLGWTFYDVSTDPSKLLQKRPTKLEMTRALSLVALCFTSVASLRLPSQSGALCSPYSLWRRGRSRASVHLDLNELGAITTIEQVTTFEQVIKKSRFIARAAPVSSAETANAFIKENADPKARHNCFAWRLANGDTRTNGDGEPGGTAGPPILAAITGAGGAYVVCAYVQHW